MKNGEITRIEKLIDVFRDQRVMLDSDLADLYEVDTRTLNQAVKRNLSRIPDDFMFQLTKEERENQRSQSVIFEESMKGRKYLPYVFTENGVAMLSSVLNSERAIQVNISIMRIFTKLRSFLALENDATVRISKLEEGTNKLFKVVFQRMDEIEEQIRPRLSPSRKKIGLKNE